MTTTASFAETYALPPSPGHNTTTTTSALPSANAHRRIELQSPSDLTYLQNNVALAARAKIDLHLPLEAALREGATGIDAMRRAVEAGVDRYIEATFAAARFGVSVNGIEAERVEWEKEVPEEFEPYDARLAARISALHATIESLNLSLANKRRTAAAAAAAAFQGTFTRQSEEMDAALLRREEAARRTAEAEGEFLGGLKLGFEGREEGVRRTWAGAVNGLEGLKGGFGETSERGKRAEDVVGYLEAR